MNNTTPSQRGAWPLDSGTYVQRDLDDDKAEPGVGKMTTANFVLMFGILALALLTIRAILMKTGSAKCRRKNSHHDLPDMHQRVLNATGTPASRTGSQTTSSCGSHVTRPQRHPAEPGLFMLSPPSYDSNHQYPSAAPPPYTPGDPAPIFVDYSHPSSKLSVTHDPRSPPPYDTLQNPNKTATDEESQRMELERRKSDDSHTIEITQL